MKIVIVLNRNAGTLRTLDADQAGKELAEIFRAAGHEASVRVAAGRDTIHTIREVARSGAADAVIVGGGDGTISAAAGIAAETGVALGVLPLGTMNFFARTLAIPTDMKGAAEALATAEVKHADIARVNHHWFVHALSLGLHPMMVEEREKLSYGSRYGKMWGSVRAFLKVLRHPHRFHVSVATEGGKAEHRTAGLVISNNPIGKGHLPYADRVDQGVLGVYVTTARGWVQLLRVVLSAAFGGVANHPLVRHLTTHTASVRLDRHNSVPTTLDGELVHITGPLNVEVVPKGLKVLKPKTRTG